MPLKRFKLVVATALVAVLTAPAAAQGADNFTCRASALRVETPFLFSEPIVANKANDPCASDSDNLATLTLGSLLTAEVLNADTTARSDGASSAASVAEVRIALGRLVITATVLQSNAAARCSAGGVAFSGSSSITRLTIGGTAITVGTQPNRTIMLPDGLGTIVINQQIKTSNRITVRALRVESPLLSTFVTVSEAIADVSGHPCAHHDDPHHHG
ncbi:MAG: hypothetical protein M3168_01425 [Actinomycetota bacterium]|nr:hypothetical protein [Actinomycetota bacterium]